MFQELMANEAARGVFLSAIGAVIAIPAGLTHKWLDELPDWTVTPQQTTAIHAGLLMLLSCVVAKSLHLPLDYAILIGTIAGGSSGTAARAMGSKPVTTPAEPPVPNQGD